MNIGPLIYAGWFAILILAEVIADAHITRRGSRGCVPGFLGIVGAFLSWAFVSAYSRAVAIPEYTNSTAFEVLLGIGIVGVLLFLVSCLTLKKEQQLVREGGAA